jgi:hypothetical protein
LDKLIDRKENTYKVGSADFNPLATICSWMWWAYSWTPMGWATTASFRATEAIAKKIFMFLLTEVVPLVEDISGVEGAQHFESILGHALQVYLIILYNYLYFI